MISPAMVDAAAAVLGMTSEGEREVVERAVAAAVAVPTDGKRPSLTPRQKVAYDFIRKRIRKTGTAPSMAEIRDHLGYASKGATHKLVSAIVDRGYLKRNYGQWRSLALA
jgi:DNA-binding MarR family transcriptional regulator